ncbi:MAG: hypothetical protein AB1696_07830 [Planctomycetota bacterium]
MKNSNPFYFLMSCLLAIVVSLVLLAADGNKPKEEKKDQKPADKKEDVDKNKDESGAKATEEKEEIEQGTHGNPVDSGLRKRWGYKERMAEALRKAEEEKKRKHEEWLADEEARREAIRRVREEMEAKKKERAAAEGAEGEKKPDNNLLPPPEKLATITMKSGCSFQGLIMAETEQDVTVKITGGEMTIDKRLIAAIQRPPEPARKQESKVEQ